MKHPAFPLIAALLLSACSSSHGGGSTADTTASRIDSVPKPALKEHVPNSVRIIGTITSINPTPSTDAPNTPCSRVPCEATVRVDSIVRTGTIIGKSPEIGESIPMTFTFTLSHTAALFPKMKEVYPGLQVGSRFEAEIFATPRNLPNNGGLTRGAPSDTKSLPAFPGTRFFVTAYTVR